jgi:tetratricopeptide (TPR) repeat protein
MKKFFLAVLLAACLVIPSTILADEATTDKDKQVDPKLIEVNKLYKEKKYDDAIKLLDEWIKTDDNNPYIYMSYMSIYLTQYKYSKAEEYAEISLEKIENHVPLMKIAAQVYMKIREYGDAVDILEDVVELVPKDVDAWIQLSSACFFDRDPSDSIDAAEEALKLDRKNLVAHANIGYSYIARNKYVQSIQAFEKGLKYHPKSEALLKGKAKAELLKKKKEIAKRSPRIPIVRRTDAL